MDAISYSYADKAQKRIKKFIENPDSTSGVLTVPKTIAAGETITIPTGRVAILPDLQVDGDLVVNGDLFIPTGSMTSQVVQKVTSTDNAVVRFDGVTGQVQNSGVIIDDNNNVGIGTNSPIDGNIHIHTVANSSIKFTNSTTGQTSNDGLFVGINSAGDAYVFNKEAKTLNLGTNNLHRMIIDSVGNVGIGVTPLQHGAGYLAMQLKNCVSIIGTTGVDKYELTNAYYDGGAWRRINATQKPTRYSTYDGSYVWSIASSGAAGSAVTFTDAMTLDASGNLLVGTSSGGIQNANSFQYLVSNGQSYVTHITGTTGGTAYAVFGYGGTQIGSITQNGTTAVSYNTTSDYRLKENIRLADCKRFMDIKFVDYERIDGRHECGIIAHELQEIYPDLVFGEKDATEIRKVEISPAIEEVKDEDGNVITEAVEAVYEEQEFPVYQQVNYIGLIARIGTVVQQQAKLIEAMQLEINELKGAK